MLNIDRKRHIAKTITWRIIGTIDTIILGSIISGDPKIGLTVGAFELLTKMTLYYFHERVWFKVKWGISRDDQSETNSTNDHIKSNNG